MTLSRLPTPWMLLMAAFAVAASQAAFGQSATVSGTVTDGSGPVAGATVAVSEPASGSHFALATDTTDGSGNYSVTISMDAGATIDVIVEAASPDHAPARHDWAEALPCYFNCGPGGEFSISDGDTLGGKDIVLEAGGTISGTLTADATGNPLDGAYVQPYQADGFEYSSHFWGVADAGGNYTTALALPAGDYFLLAHPPGGENFVVEAWQDIACQHGRGCPIYDTDPVPVVAGMDASGFDFALASGATIEGTLFPDNIERQIALYDGSGNRLTVEFIQSADLPESSWSFDGLSGGSYYVQLGPLFSSSSYMRILHNGLLCPFGGCDRARGSPITIPPGSGLSLARIDLQEGGQVDGTIVDASTGTAPTGVPTDARVGSYDIIEADGTVVGGGSIEEDSGQVVLRPSAAVPPGDYYVRTWSAWLGDGIGYSQGSNFEPISGYTDAVYPDVACAGRDCDLSAATQVTVTQNNTETVQIEIATGSNISGTVIDQATTNPVGDVVVKLVDGTNEVLAATITDDSGNYTFGAFPVGTYYVRTSAAGRYGEGHFGVQNAYFDKVHGAGANCSEELCDPTGGTAITLNGSTDATGIDMAIESGPVISGQIIYSVTGLPINRGHVEVYDASDTFVGEYRLATHRDSRYQTTALPPGDYTLVPVVSPAYADVTTSSASTTAESTAGRSHQEEGFVVTVGSESVEADLKVTDRGLLIFQDRFSTN